MGNSKSISSTSLLNSKLISSLQIDSFEKNYEIVQELGSGVTGTVWLVKTKKTKDYMAMKTINFHKLGSKQIQELKTEVKLLRTLEHPNITHLVEVYENDQELKLVMHLCKGGNLVQSRKRMKTEKDVSKVNVSLTKEYYYSYLKKKKVVYQILLAISYCHKKGVVHRDIKMENILFVSDDEKSLEIQLIDFGLSSFHKLRNLNRFEKRKLLKSVCGTSIYMAPEVLLGAYDSRCDLWSTGVLLHILLTGQAPFNGKSDHSIFQAIQKQEPTYHQPIWKHLSPTVRILTEELLTKNPEQRITALKALESHWFKEAKAQNELPSMIDKEVIESIKNFGKYGQLKKVALLVIAHHTTMQEMNSLRQLFAKLDHDNTAMIKFEEMKDFLLSSGMKEDDAVKIFNYLDVDNSGTIELVEFLAATLETFCQIDQARLEEAFVRISKGENFITLTQLEELLGETNHRTQVKQLVDSFNVQDGKISKNEFIFMLTQHLYEDVPQDF